MLSKLKSVLIGSPLPAQQLGEKRLNKIRVPAKWWQQLRHNQTSLLIKTALLYRRRTFGFQRIIIDVPYHLKK
jgi:hypothetical protein